VTEQAPAESPPSFESRSAVEPSPASDRPLAEESTGSLAPRVLAIVATGAGRLVWWWPGVVAAVAAYVVTALALYHTVFYANLWGLVAAAVVGTAWYLSPLRTLESRRRRRLRTAAGDPAAASQAGA
jgi:hypothetical protein